ncbi:uncharacterized protein LOC135849533 isoform X2 [Planococcus citri]|uniref:uncharacterized protein LOC135849533 isoform X2 n=1 Tax=Planococcus citri TaxID=170843 RepID=UPI0031F74B15
MEIDQNQEQEMAEISNAYDPEPAVPALKENSTIAIAFQVLRSEVHKYRTKNELENFNPEELHASLREKLPDLPTSIYDTIEEYVKKLGLSLENWLEEHYKRVFFFHYGRRNYVLYDFDDFVSDSSGGIDFDRTAERMMGCDRFSKAKKFKVACMYCFEDDVRRIWPSVWKKVGFDQIQFDECPQLYYWICRLSNQLNKIPFLHEDDSIDGKMFNACIRSSGTSWEYFWNRLSPEIQLQKALDVFREGEKDDLILQKLDDRQLDEFVKRRGCDLIYFYITRPHLDEGVFLRVWMHIKKVMNEDVFGELIVKILQFERDRKLMFELHPDDSRYKKSLCRCRQVWSSAPHNLRTSVIKNILPNLRLYRSNRDYSCKPCDYDRRYKDPANLSEFLFTILSDASWNERITFWDSCWHNLIFCLNFDDLQRIMEMCFENNDAIVEYKENVIVGSDIFRQICFSLLTHAYFEELNELVDFYLPNEDSAKHYKQQLLQSKFHGDSSIFRYKYFKHARRFDKFISAAYGTVDLATDFKNQLMSSPATEILLPEEVFKSRSFRFKEFLEFMEVFVSTEEMMQQKKTRVLDHLKEVALTNHVIYAGYYFGVSRPLLKEVLRWCLKNDDEAEEFEKILLNLCDKMFSRA